MAKNVLGGPLLVCSTDPVTGFLEMENDTGADDNGNAHSMCSND